MRGLIFALPVAAALTGCKKDNGGDTDDSAVKTHAVEALGVQIDAPGDWTIKDRGKEGRSDGAISVGSGTTGIILRQYKDKPMPQTMDAALRRYGMDGEIREKAALSGGGYTFLVMADFGNMKRPIVNSVVPTGEGHVHCTIQLQEDDDAKTFADACKSVHNAR